MVRVGIMTASDKGSRGERIDESGEVIRKMVEDKGWKVTEYIVLPDEKEKLAEQMMEWCDHHQVDLLLTTGGIGFSKRDCMPEATLTVVEKQVPGIPEVMRAESLKKTPSAMLNRSMAGIRKETLIINLPGSPKAVKENLEVVIDELAHGINILTGTESKGAESYNQ